MSPYVRIAAVTISPSSSFSDRRLLRRDRAPLDRLGVSLPRVVHPERQVPDAVAVPVDVVGDDPSLVAQIRPDRRGQHEPDLVLLEQVAGAVADPGLGPSIPDQLESEGGAVVVAGLLGVPDPELDVVGAVDGEGVARGGGGGQGLGLHAVSLDVVGDTRKRYPTA